MLAAGWAVSLAAKDDPEPGASQTGPGAVTIEVARDGSYGLYFPAGEAPEFAASLSCTIASGGAGRRGDLVPGSNRCRDEPNHSLRASRLHPPMRPGCASHRGWRRCDGSCWPASVDS